MSQPPKNIFNTLLSLCPPMQNELRDELDQYLGTNPEMVDDVVIWWHERCETYPSLSHMALDYLTIPGACILPFNANTHISTSNIRGCQAHIQQWLPAVITCSQSTGIAVNTGGHM